MPPFIQNLLALPAKTKAVLGVSAIAILAIAFVILKIATAPSYTLIASGLDPAQTGKITAALDSQGIAYELRNNGTALAVAKSETGQANIALAAQGVQTSAAGQPGFELLDQSKLGASQFQQQVTYQRALEGEIAKSLRGVQGVTNPTVQLVLPQDDLFQDQATPATAAVILGNSADTLQPGAVQGMASLVAGSVKGLKSDNVTITDSSGQVLWPSTDGTGTGVGGGTLKASAQARYANQLENQINAMLAATLGPGKAQVKVNADLNVDDTTKEQLTYAAKGTPLTQSTSTEAMKGSGSTTGGPAGTGSNVPSYSAGSGANVNGGSYKNKKVDTTYGVDKQVTKTKVAGGTVNKLNVALLVDKSVPPAAFNSLKQTVATAAGVQVPRGDTITATQMAFAKPVTPKAGPVPTTMLGPLKWVGLGLAALLFLFFMTRGMKRRENENLGTPAWLTTIDEPVSLAQLEAGTADTNFVANTQMLAPRVPDASLHQLDQLMEREPERVAAQVKAWMAED